MRCQWIVRRTMQPAPGGQRRWAEPIRRCWPGWRGRPTSLSARRAVPAQKPAMRVALYARVSTRRQAQTVEQQLERLTGHTRQQGWDVPLDSGEESR